MPMTIIGHSPLFLIFQDCGRPPSLIFKSWKF